MKQLFTLFLVVAFVFSSCCSSDDEPNTTDQTVFMYLPWSGDSNALTSYFMQNLNDLKTAISEGILNNERVLVFFCSTSTKASLFEIKYRKGKVEVDTLKYYTYTTPEYTTQEGITSILNDVKEFAPAKTKRYGMIIGCHGLGWLPVSSGFSRNMGGGLTPPWEASNEVITRYFGGTSSQYKTDVATLADAITSANMRMEYILFDDCYMSNIEVAYDLKDVTRYLIACPTEIMAHGMPYAEIGKYLIGEVRPDKICEEFYSFYSTFNYPYGTIGATDCTQIDALIPIMKEINENYTFDSSNISAIQALDGYSPTVFFDFGDYIAHMDIDDEDLLQAFEDQLKLVVPYKEHTGKYPTALSGTLIARPIKAYSGITISDPTINPGVTPYLTQTAWYQATH